MKHRGASSGRVGLGMGMDGGVKYRAPYGQGLTGRVFQLRVGSGSGIGKNYRVGSGLGSGSGIGNIY